MLLGCPTKRIWPSVYSMPLIASGAISLTDEQAKYPFNSFDIFLPNLSEIGYDLFSKMLAYDQRKRISARAALRHEYFYSSPYPKEQAFMPTYPTNVRTDNPYFIFSPIYFLFFFYISISFYYIVSYPTLSHPFLPSSLLSYVILQFIF
jgi:serine/threonine protein kinase